VLVEVLTDNRNRTGADVRSLFSRNGGNIAEPGAVAWQFDRKGQILVDRKVDEDELMLVALDAGAEDIADDGELWRVTVMPTDLHKVRTAIEAAAMTVDSADLTMMPQATIALEDVDAARKVLRLIDALDEHDDVQNVHANFDVPDSILESVEA
jgi:YebC/PmpR family DNA-binding regulatory protein